MASPIFCCGLECGVSGTVGQHFSLSGASVSTTTVRSGSRSVRANPTAATQVCTFAALASSTRWIVRFYVRFATLPSADAAIAGTAQIPLGPCVRFKQSDSKIYAAVGTTLGASGVSVTTGVWYRIDADFNINTGGNDTCDVRVDGTACGQATATGISAAQTQIILGIGDTCTADVFFDDLIISQTGADYPLGAGYVNHFTPTSDGAHNVAGASDFERGTLGTDITNATTDAYLLIDDVPLSSSVVTDDFINMIAPPNATDYTEHVFGPGSGISTPSTGPRAVEVIAAIHQAGTGTGNMEIRLNDNGTTSNVYSATAVAGTTTLTYKRAHFATAPTGGAWTATSGAGNFNNLRVRFGSPGAVDANPDQYLDCIMVEAEFVESAGFSVSPGTGTITATGQAVALALALNLGAGALTLTGTTPTNIINRDVAPAVGTLTIAGQTPSLNHALAVAQATITAAGQSVALNNSISAGAGALVITGETPTQAQQFVRATDVGALALSGQATALNSGVNVSAGTLTLTGTASALYDAIAADVGSLSLSGQAVINNTGINVSAGALVLEGQTPTLGGTLEIPVAVGELALTGQTQALNDGISAGSGALAFTGYAPTIVEHLRPAPSVGELSITGSASQLYDYIAVASGALALDGYAPTLSGAIQITPAVGALTLTGTTPAINDSLNVAVGALALTGNAPTVTQAVSISVNAGALAFTGQAVSLSDSIPVAAGTLALSGQTPVLNDGIAVGASALAFTGHAPTVSALATVSPDAGTLTLTGQTPALNHGIAVGTGGATLTGTTPIVNYGVLPATGGLSLVGSVVTLHDVLNISAGILELAGHVPSLSYSAVNASPDTCALVLTGYAPNILIRPPFQIGVRSSGIKGRSIRSSGAAGTGIDSGGLGGSSIA